MCVKCNQTPMQNNKKHAGCCRKCSPFVGVQHLIPDKVATVDVLVQLALKFIKAFGLKVYAGLLGTSGQSEIDQDEKRLKEAKLINKKLYQYVAYIDEDQMHNSAHATARDCERLLINKIGLYLLLNRRKGGAGRTPEDTTIGGVFIMVCK